MLAVDLCCRPCDNILKRHATVHGNHPGLRPIPGTIMSLAVPSTTAPTMSPEPTSVRRRLKSISRAVKQSLDEADASLSANGSPIIGFMLSEYSVGVLVMVSALQINCCPQDYDRICLLCKGFLLDRIQHVVAPPRNQNPTHLQVQDEPAQRARNGSRKAWLRRLWRKTVSLALPIDASASRTRFLLRLPSLVLIYRSLALNLLLLLQVMNLLPSSELARYPWLQQVEHWAVGAKMADVCWGAFIAACITLTTSECISWLSLLRQ